MSWLSLDSPASVSGKVLMSKLGLAASMLIMAGYLFIFSAVGDWSGSDWVETWVIIMWTRARGNEGCRGGVEDILTNFTVFGTENFVNVFEEESHFGGSSENRKRI